MISHDIFTWTAEHGSQCANFKDAEDSTVSYLPLCHGAAQIVDVYAALRAACTIYFAQPDALKVGQTGGTAGTGTDSRTPRCGRAGQIGSLWYTLTDRYWSMIMCSFYAILSGMFCVNSYSQYLTCSMEYIFERIDVAHFLEPSVYNYTCVRVLGVACSPKSPHPEPWY